MITITHEVRIVDGIRLNDNFYFGRKLDDLNTHLMTLTLTEAHELHTALGEKLKEIEANQ